VRRGCLPWDQPWDTDHNVVYTADILTESAKEH
jgi:hypothetical protein